MFDMRKDLDRAGYFVAGVTLFAVKVGLDLALARAFSRPYSVLYYISPSDAPLFRPGQDPSYWLAMWAVALPFIAIGFLLTLRRLRDAGLGPWLALLFFAPFANIMFFAFCALVPSRNAEADHRGGPVPDAPVRMSYTRALVLASAAGAVVGLAAFASAVFLLGSYGAALFIGAPPLSGVVSGFLFARWHRPRIAGSIWAAVLSTPLAGLVIIGFGLEGLLCLAMALPLVLLGAVLGAGIGCMFARSARPRSMTPTAAALLLFPMTLALEKAAPLPTPLPAAVESSIIIDAPVDTVWKNVVEFPRLGPPGEWMFRAGIAAPLGAVIDRKDARAVRRCIFTTGDFIEPIEIWNPPHELSFLVTASPDPMHEWTLRDGPRPPHLEGFLESTRGQFILEALPGGRTRLVGRTWYRTNMVPESYWRLWADPAIHAIHMRVLRHIAAISESAPQ